MNSETPLSLATRPDGVDSVIFSSTLTARYAIGFGTTSRMVVNERGISRDEPRVPIDLVFLEVGVHVGSGLKF